MIEKILIFVQILSALERRATNDAALLYPDKHQELIVQGAIDGDGNITRMGLVFLKHLRSTLGKQPNVITGDDPLDVLFEKPFNIDGFIDHRQ